MDNWWCLEFQQCILKNESLAPTQIDLEREHRSIPIGCGHMLIECLKTDREDYLNYLIQKYGVRDLLDGVVYGGDVNYFFISLVLNKTTHNYVEKFLSACAQNNISTKEIVNCECKVFDQPIFFAVLFNCIYGGDAYLPHHLIGTFINYGVDLFIKDEYSRNAFDYFLTSTKGNHYFYSQLPSGVLGRILKTMLKGSGTPSVIAKELLPGAKRMLTDASSCDINKPFSLLHVTRHYIRSRITNPHKVTELELPNSMKKYLIYDDE